MKAVLCLWAREHLKGRLGSGSGLAREKRKKGEEEEEGKKNPKQNSPLCMCVYVCLAKSGKTGRLCSATAGRDTLRNRHSCRCWGERKGERTLSSTSDHLFTCCPCDAGGPDQPQRPECTAAEDEDAQKMKSSCWRSRRVWEEDFSSLLSSSAWACRSRTPDCRRTLGLYLHGLLPGWPLGRLLLWMITGPTSRNQSFCSVRLDSFLRTCWCWNRRRQTDAAWCHLTFVIPLCQVSLFKCPVLWIIWRLISRLWVTPTNYHREKFIVLFHILLSLYKSHEVIFCAVLRCSCDSRF